MYHSTASKTNCNLLEQRLRWTVPMILLALKNWLAHSLVQSPKSTFWARVLFILGLIGHIVSLKSRCSPFVCIIGQITWTGVFWRCPAVDCLLMLVVWGRGRVWHTTGYSSPTQSFTITNKFKMGNSLNLWKMTYNINYAFQFIHVRLAKLGKKRRPGTLTFTVYMRCHTGFVEFQYRYTNTLCCGAEPQRTASFWSSRSRNAMRLRR
jgi:hypothetical protein